VSLSRDIECVYVHIPAHTELIPCRRCGRRWPITSFHSSRIAKGDRICSRCAYQHYVKPKRADPFVRLTRALHQREWRKGVPSVSGLTPSVIQGVYERLRHTLPPDTPISSIMVTRNDASRPFCPETNCRVMVRPVRKCDVSYLGPEPHSDSAK